MTERVPPPHDEEADEPLGPVTPDPETPLGFQSVDDLKAGLPASS